MRRKPNGKIVLPLVLTAIFSIIALIFGMTVDDSSDHTLGIWDVITPTAMQKIPRVTPSPLTPDTENHISGDQTMYSVLKVIDGDTITISLNEKNQTVRLIGINSPESVDPRRAVECFGNEASLQAKELLTGQQVRIVSDPTQADRDRYNRLLRYVYLADGTFFNKWMIAEGYAYEYTYDSPYQFQKEFKEEQAISRAQGKGLWSQDACAGTVKQPGFADKDCSDFATQAVAQAFFLTEGGPDIDPHRLDVNNDGAVCESLP